ncbi:MAG: dihydropteroate synthase [Verrucomicrobiaceae bacterium]
MSERNSGTAFHWKAGRYSWDLSQKGLIMGILNVTPDSFSDGGNYRTIGLAVDHAARMMKEGADILDVGGESTRPGAESVSEDEELERVIPVILELRKRFDVALSVDTSKPQVAAQAMDEGADIVNDVTGFRDKEMIGVCAHRSCGLVAMHMRGEPRTMQSKPIYEDVVGEIIFYFEELVKSMSEHGIDRRRVVVDPGIGFGKTLDHNLEILSKLSFFSRLERPIAVGLSRKSMIGSLLQSSGVADRDAPTVALTAYCQSFGARIHRVHDVRGNRDAVRMVESLRNY